MNRRQSMNLMLEALFGKDYPLLVARLKTEKELETLGGDHATKNRDTGTNA